MTSLDDAAQRLRARYIAGIPAKCAVLSEALAALRKRGSLDADKTLIRLAHQLRGTAASFGLLEVDAAAAQVEKSADMYELELATVALLDALQRAHAAHPRARAEILVIDDDPFIGEFMAEILRNEDIAIEQVTRASAALARLSERRWDLVFVDLVLPDADGRVLLADIRELPLQKDAALLVLSSKTGSLVKNECYMYGIDGFVHKPIDEATFPTLVSAVIERSRSREAAPAPAASRASEPAEGQAADPGRPSVLLAEDDPELASLLEHDLADDFGITHACDGEAALVAARASSFDLVLLDYHMPPGRNGIEVLRELRRLDAYRDTPILLLTAVGSDEAVEAAFEAGASDYVTKPHTRRALLARLHRHVGRPARA